MDWIQKFIDMMFPVEENSPKTEEAFLLKYKNLPKSLFKYRAINNYSIKNFKNDTIWLSNPFDFNDP